MERNQKWWRVETLRERGKYASVSRTPDGVVLVTHNSSISSGERVRARHFLWTKKGLYSVPTVLRCILIPKSKSAIPQATMTYKSGTRLPL